MKKILSILVLFFVTFSVFATHNRAGEITYEQISEFTYKFTIVTYTNTVSAADRPEVTVFWGDGTSSDIQRVQETQMIDDIKQNIYMGQHTFSGPGVFAVIMSDPNRNEDIVNIPGSVNIVFTLKTILRIDGLLGFNNTPILLNPPVDKAAIGIRFVHNPSAFDVDGDSISYKLATCLGENGVPITAYGLPNASDTIYVNPITGDLVWDTPEITGNYNIAMEIEEWRNGLKIGSIIRDMQIRVTETNNHPPVIDPPQDYCVTAGEYLTFDVTATDQDDDGILLSASGGPFQMEENRAIFDTVFATSSVTGTFQWSTHPTHVRRLPFTVVFRAADNNSDVSLSDYQESKITVNAPEPTNLTAIPSTNTVDLTWAYSPNTIALGYRIYRKNSSYTYSPPDCVTGIPEDAGYELIKETTTPQTFSYTDGSIGNGLIQGYEYCYRIVAYFDDGAESYPSDEVCVELKRENPIFIETTVNITGEQNGEIYLKWLRPTAYDETIFLPPFHYKLYSSVGINTSNYSLIEEIPGVTSFEYNHLDIDTKNQGYTYKITLFGTDSQGKEIQVGTPAYTTSVFLEATPADRRIDINLNHETPWTNYQFVIYRKSADELCNPNTEAYDSVGVSNTPEFTNYGLENDKYYWFKAKTTGEYGLDYLPAPLVNFSQESCISPNDTTPPCKLSVSLDSNCENLNNILSWEFKDCENDAAEYLVYFSSTTAGELELVETITSKDQFSFEHFPETSLAGCYAVAAKDSAGNSIPADELVRYCVDNCTYYELPNIFTPNGDGVNDLYTPLPYKFVSEIDIQIFNRWGNLIFQTSDPEINWDGKDQNTGKAVSDGAYYYLCDVYEQRLTGIEVRNLNGFIQIIGNNDSGNK